MNVAVVILNWNGRQLLEKFLPTVIAYSSNATIYVADNASTDGSTNYVSANFPMVHILHNASNGGYAKGYNDALQGVSEELLILLNSDVEVTPNWIDPLISAFKKEKTLVAAQPKILDYTNKDTFEYAGAAGGFLDSLAYPYCRGRIFDTLEKDEGQYNDTVEIFWATGACLVIRNSSFIAENGFDEDFFAHQEEIDLCWRLQASGGKVKYIGNSVVYHVGGATLDVANPRKTFFNFRNTLLLLVKNVSGVGVWITLFIRMTLDAVAFFQFLLRGKIGHGMAILKAHFSFYRLLPKFLKKRKKYATTLKYAHSQGIIWKYFIQNKKKFHQL